jgi:hypothetical protein
MNCLKKIFCFLTIVASSINASNAMDEKSMEEFDTSGTIVETQNMAQFDFNRLSDEVRVMVLSSITELTDIQNCMSACGFFHGELKKIVIRRMDIHNVCYQSLPPFFIGNVLKLVKDITVVQERMPDGTIMDIYNQKIVYKDRYNKTFEITGGKSCINPTYGYKELGDLNSLLIDLRDADLYELASYHERDGGGCGPRSDWNNGLVYQGWILMFQGKEYNLFFREFIAEL